MQKETAMHWYASSCSNCSCQIPDWSTLRFDASDWLEDREVMRMFRISASTLFRLKRRRELPFVRCGSKAIFNRLMMYHCLLFKRKCAVFS